MTSAKYISCLGHISKKVNLRHEQMETKLVEMILVSLLPLEVLCTISRTKFLVIGYSFSISLKD